MKPFINQHERISSESTDSLNTAEIGPLSSTVPFNAELIALGNNYRESAPSLLLDKIQQTRDFILQDIAPVLLAVQSGMQDSEDILETAFEEKPDLDAIFMRIQHVVRQAVDVRITSFAQHITGLSKAEANQFVLMSMSKDLKSHEGIAGLLSQIQEVVHPTTPRKKVPVKRKPRLPRKPVAAARKQAKARLSKQR